MARTSTVKAARKDQGKCRGCGTEIKEGMPYKWAKPRYKAKIVLCMSCPMKISYTSSSKMVTVWETQEEVGKLEGEDIPQGLRDLAQAARDVAEEYRTSAENKQEYFPDAEDAQEWSDKADNLDSWADDLDEAADEADGIIEEANEIGSTKEKMEIELTRLQEMDATEQMIVYDDESDSVGTSMSVGERITMLETKIAELETEIEQKIMEIDTSEIDNCPD